MMIGGGVEIGDGKFGVQEEEFRAGGKLYG